MDVLYPQQHNITQKKENEMSDETKDMRAGQFWFRGTVESYSEVTRGNYTAKYLRVFVPNGRNPKYPDTYFVKVLDKAAEKLTAQVGDEVEVTCYVSSRLNNANDGAWLDCTLAYCKVVKAGYGVETESGTLETDAAPVDEPKDLPF